MSHNYESYLDSFSSKWIKCKLRYKYINRNIIGTYQIFSLKYWLYFSKIGDTFRWQNFGEITWNLSPKYIVSERRHQHRFCPNVRLLLADTLITADTLVTVIYEIRNDFECSSVSINEIFLSFFIKKYLSLIKSILYLLILFNIILKSHSFYLYSIWSNYNCPISRWKF